MLRSGSKACLLVSLRTSNLAVWKTTRFSAVNAVSFGSLFLRRSTRRNTVRVVGLNQRSRSNTMARRVFRGMVTLTVRIGLWFAALGLCLVTVFVVIPIVWLLHTLSVAVFRIKQTIRRVRTWLKI
jgi:hypothetical protein